VIPALLDLLRRRGLQGDALRRRADTTSISFEAGRLKAAAVSEQAGINLRVVKNGRVGVAGTTATGDAELEALADRAAASAELGEALELAFPRNAPHPPVVTYFDAVADVSLDALTGIGREMLERLTRDGVQVNVTIEREVAETEVANTAGAHGAYVTTALTVAADLTRIAGDDVLMVYDYYTGCGLPGAADLDALVASITTRLDLALRVAPPPEGALPVVFTPSGLAAILLPLQQALSGKSVLQGISPLAGKIGQQAFDLRFSITDDPVVSGRPGSRPVDDEGVRSAALPLVAGGVVRHFVYDLETAARVAGGATSTGHGARGIFGKPHIGYSNLVIGVADDGPAADDPTFGGGLVAGIADGLVVDDLIGVGQGNVAGGAFSHPVALAYRIEQGQITGRVKDAAVAGNAYDLLQRIGGAGGDGRWLGSRWSPSLLLEGVSVARR
jgi:PmbA protein